MPGGFANFPGGDPLAGLKLDRHYDQHMRDNHIQEVETEHNAARWLRLPEHQPIKRYSGEHPIMTLFSFRGTAFSLIVRRHEVWLLFVLHFVLAVMQQNGWEKHFEGSPLELPTVMITMGFSQFFTVLYSKDSYSRFDMLYQSCCKVCGIINEICMWLMLYFPGEDNRKTRWEIGRHAVASQFLLFYSLDGQSLTELNWRALAESDLVTELEVLEFRKWTGAPRFILPIIKLMETARLALHARESGVSYDTESKKWQLGQRKQVKASRAEEARRLAEATVGRKPLLRKQITMRRASNIAQSDEKGRVRSHSTEEKQDGSESENEQSFDMHDMHESGMMKDSVTIAVQHTEIFDLVKELRNACANINNSNLCPPPYLYFHLLNVIILLSLVMLAYALAQQGTYLTLPVYGMCLIVNIGLREVSTSMADPFRGKDGDFPLASWLKSSMDMLLHTTYASRREAYMAETAPIPPEDLVDSNMKMAEDARKHALLVAARKSPYRKEGREGLATWRTTSLWECKADSGWVEYDPRISDILEAAYADKLDVRFETRHKLRGICSKDTLSEWAEYIVDWETFEQVNVRTHVRRQIRRVNLQRDSAEAVIEDASTPRKQQNGRGRLEVDIGDESKECLPSNQDNHSGLDSGV